MAFEEMKSTNSEYRKIGRPSLYTPEILEKAQNYLEIYESLGHVMPSNVGLSLHLGITRETVQAWGRDSEKKEFSYILDRIQAEQELVLFNKGLVGEFNSNICKLALGKHGYHDKQDTSLSGYGGGPIQTEIIQTIVDPLEEK